MQNKENEDKTSDGNITTFLRQNHFIKTVFSVTFLLSYLNANSSCLVIPMSFNETEVGCDISRNVHVNSVFTKSHYETQSLILNSNDANNLEDKCAATESREIKQELYCQSFIIMQRSGINRVFL